jgi:hypothetical protein
MMNVSINPNKFTYKKSPLILLNLHSRSRSILSHPTEQLEESLELLKSIFRSSDSEMAGCLK